MPIAWTAEANAKLFLGVLTQTRSQNMKLDYTALAEYMGSGCTVRAVQQQIDKLRKQVSDGASNPNTPAGTPRKKAATDASGGTPSKAVTPAKRKASRIAKPKTPTKKSKGAAKTEVKEDEDDDDIEDDEKFAIKDESSDESDNMCV
ncbi:uncharacterized protein BO97DRAFT_475437 [Aspergillus homomorphus CBS 101889]|uniref:Uncharacterized protein n=1 Tax=Aspergillus homomorphus (strain CBS 101889) TaxID=1450537 RepID=A0A395IC88_ASPHC|nr:hypothetical protein BO97DRAFT_475437 [Aspergillus homomorphus CBS 101889]RAL15784.1 hypothetical protein BO97DRAFT_475437 [Aspergillus homomorphus CBS 101889]